MKMNKTVSSIVQDLLEKGQITAEDALVLLKAESNKPCCLNTQSAPCTPIYPAGPPLYPNYPQVWYTNGTTENTQSLNDNFTSK
jgi:hypothetical protein